MIYTANITTEIDKFKTKLKKTVLHVTKGLVYKVEFYFPSGSAGLMGVAVFDGLYQVWPSSVGEFFIGEDHVVSFDDLYLKESAPYKFQIYTYNIDDVHGHFVSVRIGLVSSEVFMARFMPTKGHDYLAKLRKQMRQERATIFRKQTELVTGTKLKRLPWELKLATAQGV